MPRNLAPAVAVVTAIAVALPPSFAQPKPAPVTREAVTEFNVEQFDAMPAATVLYPGELLRQVLMASTYPLQAAARRWLEEGNNKKLKGTALTRALEGESCDL